MLWRSILSISMKISDVVRKMVEWVGLIRKKDRLIIGKLYTKDGSFLLAISYATSFKRGLPVKLCPVVTLIACHFIE